MCFIKYYLDSLTFNSVRYGFWISLANILDRTRNHLGDCNLVLKGFNQAAPQPKTGPTYLPMWSLRNIYNMNKSDGHACIFIKDLSDHRGQLLNSQKDILETQWDIFNSRKLNSVVCVVYLNPVSLLLNLFSVSIMIAFYLDGKPDHSVFFYRSWKSD